MPVEGIDIKKGRMRCRDERRRHVKGLAHGFWVRVCCSRVVLHSLLDDELIWTHQNDSRRTLLLSRSAGSMMCSLLSAGGSDCSGSECLGSLLMGQAEYLTNFPDSPSQHDGWVDVDVHQSKPNHFSLSDPFSSPQHHLRSSLLKGSTHHSSRYHWFNHSTHRQL
jgi:hypothetical protein